MGDPTNRQPQWDAVFDKQERFGLHQATIATAQHSSEMRMSEKGLQKMQLRTQSLPARFSNIAAKVGEDLVNAGHVTPKYSQSLGVFFYIMNKNSHWRVNAKNPDFLKYGDRVDMFLVLFLIISIK